MTISASHTFESKNIFFFNLLSFSSSPKTSQNHHLLCRNRMRLWFHRHGMFPKHGFILGCCNKSCQGREDHCGNRTGNGENKIKRCFRFENHSKFFLNSKIIWNIFSVKKTRKNGKKNSMFLAIFGWFCQMLFKNERNRQESKTKTKKTIEKKTKKERKSSFLQQFLDFA